MTEHGSADVAEITSEMRRTSREVSDWARVAGLKDFTTPTLEQVDRRRVELFSLTFFILILFSLAVALLSTPVVELPEFVSDLGATGTVVRVSLVLLSLSFGLFIWEKEKSLRRLATALTNERVLAAALSNRLKEISSLSEAGKAVVSVLELEDVLAVILNAAFDLLEGEDGSIMLVEGDDLLVATAVGPASAFIGKRTPTTHGLAGHVARIREPLLVEGRPDLDEFQGTLEPSERQIASSICIPLEAKGELLGVLNLNVVTGDRRFNEYDLRALTLFGEHAAMAIRHARALRKERDLRTRLVELDRARTEMVGTMTHDLKTPLTTILGSAKMLMQRGDELDADRQRELIASVERQSQRLLALIDRLLEASRSQVAHSLEPGPLDLVPQVRALAGAYASAHDRTVDVEAQDGRIEAFADPDAVEHIVANLLENAVKYTPPDAAITVRLAERDDRAVIEISDRGPGIPPENVDGLFEPFRRHEANNESGGVGLGLFIVRNLCEAMGGSATASSTVGEGTTFRIELPVRREDAPATATAGTGP